jgi:hypothetical protein
MNNSHVILSEEKNLFRYGANAQQLLRFAQDDNKNELQLSNQLLTFYF